jgi:hypothetical protein
MERKSRASHLFVFQALFCVTVSVPARVKTSTLFPQPSSGKTFGLVGRVRVKDRDQVRGSGLGSGLELGLG